MLISLLWIVKVVSNKACIIITTNGIPITTREVMIGETKASECPNCDAWRQVAWREASWSRTTTISRFSHVYVAAFSLCWQPRGPVLAVLGHRTRRWAVSRTLLRTQRAVSHHLLAGPPINFNITSAGGSGGWEMVEYPAARPPHNSQISLVLAALFCHYWSHSIQSDITTFGHCVFSHLFTSFSHSIPNSGM